MTNIKTLATAGLLFGAAAVSFATTAGVKVLPTATKTTAAPITVVGSLGDEGSLNLTGVQLNISYDATKLTLASGAFAKAAGTDWVVQAEGSANGVYSVSLTSNNGQLAGVVGTVTGTLASAGATKIAVTTDSAVSDDQYITFPNTLAENASIFTGSYRNLGAAIKGAPSVGFDKKVAVAAGGKLQLLNGADLTDVAGFAAPAVGAVSGRPAFGVVGTDPVVAVGDDAGALTVVKVADGTSVFTKTLGAKVSTPAIDADGTVYAAVTNATGAATLVKVVAGADAPVATLAGSTVLGAPAVYNGGIAVGTEKGVESFRADGTPQAGITDAAGASVAPIIGAGGKALSANATKILGFNVTTGAPTTGSVAHGATGVSELWYDYPTDTVLAGTPSGKLLQVNLTTGAPTLSAALSTLAITAEPIQLGKIWAFDASGNLVSDGGDSIALAGPSTTALAATGRTTGNSVIAATADGGVAAVDF